MGQTTREIQQSDMLILWEELAPLWDQHLISSEGNILPPPQSTQLPSTKLLKVNYQASCLWAFGRHSRSISNPLQIWPTSPGSGVPSCASPPAFYQTPPAARSSAGTTVTRNMSVSRSLLSALVSDYEMDLQTHGSSVPTSQWDGLKESWALWMRYFWSRGLSHNGRLITKYS